MTPKTSAEWDYQTVTKLLQVLLNETNYVILNPHSLKAKYFKAFVKSFLETALYLHPVPED